MTKLLTVLALFAVAVLTIVLPTAAIAKPRSKHAPKLSETTGAFVTNAVQIKHVDGMSCGLQGRTWLGGSPIAGKRFLTYTRRAANLTKLARTHRGKAASQERTRAKQYRVLASIAQGPCRQPDGAFRATTTDTPSGVCGKHANGAGDSYSPGLRTTSSYFVPFYALAARLSLEAKFATKAAAATLRARAAQYAADDAADIEACHTLDKKLPTITPPQVFDFSGAVGLAIEDIPPPAPVQGSLGPYFPSQMGSNLRVLLADGTSRDAMTSGSSTISGVVTAPNGDHYVVASGVSFPLDSNALSRTGCGLIRVPVNSTVPECIDPTLQVDTGGNADFEFPINQADRSRGAVLASPLHPWMQFDAVGDVFYSGYIAGGTNVLRRRAPDGTFTDFAAGSHIQDFAVRPDGTLFVSGNPFGDDSTGWTRRINRDGSIVSLYANARAQFVQILSDGNVYFGSPGVTGVRRYLTASNTIDPTPWDTSGCLNCGGTLVPFAFTAEGTEYGVNGGKVGAFYPTANEVTTSIINAFRVCASGTQLIISGADVSGHQRLVRIDPGTGAETTLLDSTNEIEIYHMVDSATPGHVLFEGHRLADDTYVYGDIDVATGAVVIRSTHATPWYYLLPA